MDVRWSDVVALAAISTGALVPTALLLGRAEPPPAPTLQIGATAVQVEPVTEPVESEPVEVDPVELTLCFEEQEAEGPSELEAERRFLQEQIALQETEMRSLQEAVDGIRERVRGEIDAARRELASEPGIDPARRQELIESLNTDLTRMIEAEIVAERAMADVALNLQRRLAILEVEAATRTLEADGEGGKKKKKKRKRRPCR